MTRAPMIGLADRSGRPVSPHILRVGLLLVIAFVVLAAGAGYWQVMEAQQLSTSPDNPAVVAAHRNILRGIFYDRDGHALVKNAKDANGEPYRVYPDKSVAPLLGYASRYYGTGGLEQALDAQLTGMSSGDPALDALRKFQSNPYDPANVTLSISLALQQQAVAALAGYNGAVVMLDPTTGEILAMASTPTYDATGIASPKKATADAAWKAVQAPSANQPLLDRPVQGLYTPGSAFKILTSIAALSSGAITPTTTFPDQPGQETRGFIVDGFKVTDGHHPWTGATALDYNAAIENSCNIYFAHVGLKTGGDALTGYAQLAGFNQQIPILGADLSTAISRVNNGTGTFGGGFQDAVDLANAAYGQSEVQVTPLQMAMIAATVANKGLLMTPQLVLKTTTSRNGDRVVSPQPLRDVMPPDIAAEITTAMVQAVEGQDGRLFTVGAAVPGVQTAGKSGTAQLASGAPHSWFIGFAPADNPKVAIAVIAEHGGKPVASGMAGKLMTYYLKNVLGQSSTGAARFAAIAPAADLISDRREAVPSAPGRG